MIVLHRRQKRPSWRCMTVHTLDLLFQDTPGLIAAYLIESAGALALVETGPGSTLPALRAGIRRLGLDEAAVRQVFVTHIHLDHAGAAGWWAARGAQVFCHAQAARHLIDPARLVDSARQVYGDRMEPLWGEMLPAPAERVTVLQDGEAVPVGEASLVAWDTPGHARHHHAYVLGDACFTGDVAGMRLERSPYLSVTAAPPQFDPPAYEASVDRLLAGRFRRLYLTHFGAVDDVTAHLQAYRLRIGEVQARVRGWLAEGCDAAEIRRRYTEAEAALASRAGLSAAAWRRHEQANAAAMCADGVRLSLEKRG